MWQKWSQVWKIKDLRKRVLFVIAMLVLYRFIANIPLPGVNVENLNNLINSNQFFGLLNVFSGGTVANFSIALLGVGPYITSSIIFQLLASIIPKFEEMQKEGGTGQQKINQYTRIATIPLAILQAYATITLLKRSVPGVITIDSIWQWIVAITVVTAGSVLLMWIGELITEKKVGNGVSLIIFAGIVSVLPNTIRQQAAVFDSSQLPTLLAFLGLGFVTILGIVFITEGQRKIPIIYARQSSGRTTSSVKNFLPLRVNQAGVIPIIFAVSLLIFPSLVLQYLSSSRIGWLANFSTEGLLLIQNQIIYGSVYFVFVFIFTYFYTSVIFHPDQIAENLQRQGSFIPGIRPGEPTREYLQKISNRILLAGALFLGIIAILPIAVQEIFNLTNLAIGGTSLLIVVSVVVELVKQIEAQIVMRDYESF